MKFLSYCLAGCLLFSFAFAITDEALNKMGEDAHQKIMSQNNQYRDAVVCSKVLPTPANVLLFF
jgi:hypothetical protein